jgi:hypothetical protein
MDPANVKLTPRQAIAIVALAALFGVPAVAMVELQFGPGRWVVELQERFMGGYCPVSSVVMVMGIELACVLLPLLIVALGVRFATGRTLLEVIHRRRK